MRYENITTALHSFSLRDFGLGCAYFPFDKDRSARKEALLRSGLDSTETLLQDLQSGEDGLLATAQHSIETGHQQALIWGLR